MKLFSLPILCGIALGVLFPYSSLSLIWVSSLALFLLLFLNTLAVDKKKILASARSTARQVVLAQLLIFVFFPILQTALAAVLLQDPDFIFGVAVSSLAPCALVNPFFARVRGGNVSTTWWNVLVSTVLCPFATLPMLHFLGLNSVFIEARFLALYLLTLTAGPVVLSWLFTRVWQSAGPRVQPLLPMANSCLLALLMFILVGSSLNRVPIRFLLNQDFTTLVAFFVFVDFGIFIILRHVANWFLEPEDAESMALSVATRNFAVSASLMLFFHPKAALPSAVGLIIHAVFFQFLLTRFKKSPELHAL